MSKLFVKVEDGVVVKRAYRPFIENVSNPELFSDAELAVHGWFVLEREQAEGEVFRYRTVVEEGRVREVPVPVVDERPIAEPWEAVEEGFYREENGVAVKEYTKHELSLGDYKSRKKDVVLRAAKDLLLLEPYNDLMSWVSERYALIDAAKTRESVAAVSEEYVSAAVVERER